MTTAALSDAPLAHALTDLAGRFLGVDDRFCELLRRERADVIGRTILDVTADDDRPLNAEKLEMLRERGTSFTIRKAYLCGDGATQSVENAVSLLSDGLGGLKLAATIRAVDIVADTRFATTIRIGRLLLAEGKLRASLPAFFQDADWRLLLAAYILEAEGKPVWARDLSGAVGGDDATNILRIWELVHADALAVDGTPLSLDHASVRVSLAMTKLIEQHLLGIEV